MKLARKLGWALLFIFGHHNRSLPLHIRLWVIWREVKSRINIFQIREEPFSLNNLGDEAFLRRLTGFQTIEEFTAHIRRREEPKFFFQPESKENMIATLERSFPEARGETLDNADRIFAHIFNLLGSGPVRVGNDTKSQGNYESVDWHVDFKSGYRWDVKTYFKDIQYGHIKGVDIKVPWELSRFQHLVTLGKAYWFTADGKYAREFVSEIEDWIQNNPLPYGVNWTCTMDVAIRAVNWIWGYYFFKDSTEVTDEFLLKFVKSLYLHGKFIMGNLEGNPWGMNSNHYLSDLAGLIYLGVIFPEWKEAKKWRGFAVRELISEMKKQVYPDGVDYEGSISYHRLTTELFLSATLLCLKNGVTFPDSYIERLKRMIEFVIYYAKPDGTAPQIGDNDDGRVHILAHYGGWNRLDHRYLLSIGAALFNRQEFKEAAGELHEEVFWLLGEEGLKRFNDLPKRKASASSKSFARSGFYIIRQDSLCMIVDCVPVDLKAPSGHKHNSRLSFELFAYDKSFIIDPGAYIYTADKEMRNLFRSTGYHNTVVVDNQEQNRFTENELFSIGHEAILKVNKWQSNEEYDFLDAEHHGYKRLKNPVIHRRQIYFDKLEGYWVVKDILNGRGSHQFDLYFHFAPLEVELDNEFTLVVKTKTKGANFAIIPLETEGLSVEILDGWVSYQYGVKEKASNVKYSKNGQVPTCFCNIIYPYTEKINISDIIDRKVQGSKAAELLGG